MSDTPEYCENFKALAINPNADNEKRLFVRLRCKMWTCAYCAEKNRQIWRATLIHHVHETGGNWSWFTLTAHSKRRTKAQSLKNLRGAWDTLVKRMKRKFGNFSYARIFEQHKDGAYHLHCIASFHFGDIKIRTSKSDGSETKYSAWLAKEAASLKLGFYTHADDIPNDMFHSGYIASYITKYIVKLTPEGKAEFGRVRHIQVSENWIRRKMEGSGSWEFKFGIYERDLDTAGTKYRYVDASTGETVTYDNFADTYIYPKDFENK